MGGDIVYCVYGDWMVNYFVMFVFGLVCLFDIEFDLFFEGDMGDFGGYVFDGFGVDFGLFCYFFWCVLWIQIVFGEDLEDCYCFVVVIEIGFVDQLWFYIGEVGVYQIVGIIVDYLWCVVVVMDEQVVVGIIGIVDYQLGCVCVVDEVIDIDIVGMQ